MIMDADTIPFGMNDLDPQMVVDDGPPKRIKCFVRGCSRHLEPARWNDGPTCPEHGIRCNNSGTFSYGDPKRNIIVDREIFGQRIIGHPDKFESSRLGSEKSEDALSWNVFRSFQQAGCLGKLAAEVFGLPTDVEPELFLWGINLNDGSFSFWDLLTKARTRFESNLPVKRPLTEPDIMLHVPGRYLALIEAKFTSENGVYVVGRREKPDSLTAEELLSIYSHPSLELLDVGKAMKQPRIHYQLWRNTVFAEWMARQGTETSKAYHLNLVRAGHDKESAEEFHGLVSEGFRDRFRQVTWEGIYKQAAIEGPKLNRLCKYMQEKTANLQKAFCC
jgi:hypothetical protein